VSRPMRGRVRLPRPKRHTAGFASGRRFLRGCGRCPRCTSCSQRVVAGPLGALGRRATRALGFGPVFEPKVGAQRWLRRVGRDS
jgi:hypothetical protein